MIETCLCDHRRGHTVELRTMKLLLLVTALSVCGWGQVSQSTTTNGLANGRLWKSINTGAGKSGFLLGYINGIMYCAAVYPSLNGQTSDVTKGDQVERLRKLLFPTTLTLDEIAAALDHFYESPERGPIPIASALDVISFRASGGDEAAVQKMISDLLKTTAN